MKSRATNHENSRGSPSIAAAILLRWWQMMARSKAYDPLRQSAFESSSRFEGASEMASNAIILMDLLPLACMIISLGCLLIDRSLGGAMDSVYGDREAIAAA